MLCEHWWVLIKDWGLDSAHWQSSIFHPAELPLASCLTGLSVVLPFGCLTGDRWRAAKNNSLHLSHWVHTRLNIFIYPSHGDNRNGVTLEPFHDKSNTSANKSVMEWWIIRSLLLWSFLWSLGCSGRFRHQRTHLGRTLHVLFLSWRGKTLWLQFRGKLFEVG